MIRPRVGPGRTNPARAIALAVAGVLLLGTLALLMPASSQPGHAPHVVDALFNAVSALCVTGLTTVDTHDTWTPLGQAVIAVLMQIGGLGVVTLSTLLAMLVAHRLGLRRRMVATAETRGTPAEIRAVVRGIAVTLFGVEALLAAVLLLRFLTAYDMSVTSALGTAVFHAISAVNNAGFALFRGNLIGVDVDPFILVPLAIGVIIGGLGFPVIAEVLRHYRLPSHWTLTTRLVLVGTPVLLLVGTAATLALEHANPGTLGPMGWGQKLMNAFFHATVSRTAGFNAVDVGLMRPETWLITDLLMLIGGGPAGTAGGLKITTVVVLFAIVRSELRGDSFVLLQGRRLSRAQHREVITIVMLMLSAVMTATLVLMLIEADPLDRVLFEVVSAATTTGLSTGITPHLHPVSKLILCALMFAGRVGPMTLGTALALRRRPLLYEPAKERLLSG